MGAIESEAAKGVDTVRVSLDAARSPYTNAMGSHLADADMPALARDILADSSAAKRLLEKVFIDDLARSSELMASGRRVEALAELDRMYQVYGPLPDINFRRAVLRLRENNVSQAVAELRIRADAPLRDREGLLDEISARLSDERLPPESRTDFDRLQKLAWFDDAARPRDLGVLFPIEHEGASNSPIR